MDTTPLPVMVVIETHEEDGVTWGVSIHGPNPEPDQFVQCRDKAHAFTVKKYFDRGVLSPWLEAMGAITN